MCACGNKHEYSGMNAMISDSQSRIRAYTTRESPMYQSNSNTLRVMYAQTNSNPLYWLIKNQIKQSQIKYVKFKYTINYFTII